MDAFSEITDSWQKIWDETGVKPDMLYMAWDTACELARLHGIALPSHLIPGKPVVLNTLGFFSDLEE